MIFLVISLIKHRNKSGARTVPCGTPDVTGAESLGWPFIITHCDLFKTKSFIQVSKSPRIPYSDAVCEKDVDGVPY